MSQADFLQSADWARFQVAIGHPVFEIDRIRFFQTSLPFGGLYLYCPHPDVTDRATFLERAFDLAREQRGWFVRVEPNVGSVEQEARSEKQEVRSKSGSRFTVRPTLAVQPADTWHVPLADDATMLAAMHEKTRYNIRVAEKHGVTVRLSTHPTDVEILTTLLGKTGERAGIRLHSGSYYRTMLEILGQNSEQVRSEKLEARSDPTSSHLSPLTSRLSVELVIAESPTSPEGLRGASAGQPIAAALVAHYGDRTIYLHGGSDYDQRSMMAPHLLHWRVMQRAQAVGQAVYDMGGVSPALPPSAKGDRGGFTMAAAKISPSPSLQRGGFHSWAGISRFKQGFGGYAIHYPPALDVVVNRGLYSIYQLGRRLTRSVR